MYKESGSRYKVVHSRHSGLPVMESRSNEALSNYLEVVSTLVNLTVSNVFCFCTEMNF